MPRQRTRRGPPKRLTNVQVDYINKIMKELMVRDKREKKQLGREKCGDAKNIIDNERYPGTDFVMDLPGYLYKEMAAWLEEMKSWETSKKPLTEIPAQKLQIQKLIKMLELRMKHILDCLFDIYEYLLNKIDHASNVKSRMRFIKLLRTLRGYYNNYNYQIPLPDDPEIIRITFEYFQELDNYNIRERQRQMDNWDIDDMFK